MEDYIINALIIAIFIYVTRMFWIFSKRKQTSQGKLLFKTISLFILLHFIVFPLIYVVQINRNPESIKIEKSIIESEKEIKLKKLKSIKQRTDSILNNNREKYILTKLLHTDKNSLEKIIWREIDDSRLVFLDSIIIRGNTKYRVIPDDDIRKLVTIYKSDGTKLIEFSTTSKKENLAEIILEYLIDLNSEVDLINEQIKIVESNAFWNYRQVLPYTLNILFTSNFTPQSRTANVIYFIHNIMVAGFLLTFIIGLFQNYLLVKDE
ncbi:hypothetical protein [Aquimarina mytili]|uniref:Uncharacterized protein n=1 Tax=Aquimarina mytili TaxID=874423 RepID=A0A937DB98_9FLAO|nr:hypothetical protein [Aquimarina mytili]MBL0683591.1 hypothetical protein [Aquimarina mytili]